MYPIYFIKFLAKRGWINIVTFVYFSKYEVVIDL